MKKIISVSLFIVVAFAKISFAQNPTPAPANTGSILISGGTIHVGNGKIIENGFIRIEKNKIVSMGSMTNIRLQKADKMIDATGKQIYPGLIAANTTLGLLEIEEARQHEIMQKLEIGTQMCAALLLTIQIRK